MAGQPLSKSFWRVLASSTVSYAGDGIMLVALPLLARDVTDDPLLIAAVVAAQQLPWLLFGVWAGIRVDRSDPVRTMVFSDVARMLIVGIVAIAAVADLTSIWLLILAAFGIGLGDIAFAPASASLYPRLVNDTQLARANGLASAGAAVGEGGLGPLAGGFLYSAANAVPFAANALSFGVSAVLLRGVSVETEESPAEEAPPSESVRGALRWFFSNRPLVLLTALATVVALGNTTVISVLVVIGKDELGLSDGQYGLFYALGAFGNVIGGLLADRVWDRFGTRTVMIGCAVLAAIAYAVTGQSSSAVLTAAILFVESLAIPVLNVITATLRQTLAPPDRRGQATNIFRLFVLGAIPIGAAIGGLVASQSSATDSATVASLIIAIGGAFVFAAVIREPSFAGGAPGGSDDTVSALEGSA